MIFALAILLPVAWAFFGTLRTKPGTVAEQCEDLGRVARG